MQKVTHFIKQGWFLSLIGIIILSIVIYFVTPMLIDDESTAMIATIAGIAILIIGWMGAQLLGIILSRKKNEQILDSLQELDERQGAVDEEVDILRERLSSAINELKNTKIGKKGGSSYLYQLPWYIIIGPPASGKTTLLKNSSLKTALSDKFGRDSISGIGGTRYCDWWFAEDAVLLDTAGRYTTQDSHAETDKKAWLGFLDLLKKNRTRRPLNGILIAISMDELLTSSNIHQHASEIRKRLQELYDQFNLKLPVYLMFTKTDLLAGFTEFFDDLDRDARAQVWGTTFTHNNKIVKEPLPLLKQELDLLEEQLKNKLILKLEKEVDIERRKKIYTFPEQFRSIKNSVDTFVNEVFAASRYQHKIFLRGVYFTSAEQTGSPIDKLLNNMARTFGFEHFNSSNARSRGKSFFIDNLLQRVIFPESELAGLNPAYEKRQQMIQWVTIGLAAVTLFTSIGFWLTSYLLNSNSIEKLSSSFTVLEESARLHSGSGDLRNTLDIMNKSTPLFQQDSSTLATFGLSQQVRLQEQTQVTYEQVLQFELLPHILKTLETQLRNNTPDKKSLFNTLKAYLLFSHPEYFQDQKPLIKALITKAWEEQPLTPEMRQQLGQHLDALLSINPAPSLGMAKLNLDKNLVENTRKTLSEIDVSELIYEQVKTEIKLTSNLQEFVLAGSKGAVKNIDSVFERKNGDLLTGIDGLYTYKGYQAFKEQSGKYVQTFIQDNWVLGDGIKTGDFNTIAAEVGSLYLTEYQNIWETLLLDLKIITPTSLEQASSILTTLANPPSPLQKLLKAVADETYLSKPLEGLPEGSEERALKEAERMAIQATGRVGSTLSNIAGSQALTSLTGKDGDDPVSLRFEPIRTLATDNDPALNRIIKEIDALGIKLRDAKSAMPQEMLVEQQRLLQKSLEDLQAATNNLSPTVTGWILEIRKSILELLGNKSSSIQNSLWGTEVYSVYQNKIQGKYPVAGSAGGNEIPLGDFQEFFGPNGVLDKHFQKNLANRVDRSQTEWKSADSISPISQNALQQLKLAGQIRDAFFPNGTFGVEFEIKPEGIPTNITKLVLDIGGSKSEFNNGAILKPTKAQWSGGFVSLEMTTADGVTTSLSAEGQWALIELFTQKGSIQKTSGNSYQVMLPSESGNIAFTVNVSRSDNLFNAIKELRNFKCPPDLGR